MRNTITQEDEKKVEAGWEEASFQVGEHTDMPGTWKVVVWRGHKSSAPIPIPTCSRHLFLSAIPELYPLYKWVI